MLPLVQPETPRMIVPDIRTTLACCRTNQIIYKNYETEESVDNLVEDEFACIDHVHIYAENTTWGTSVMITSSENQNFILVTCGNKKNRCERVSENRNAYTPFTLSNNDCPDPSAEVHNFFSESYFNDGLRKEIELNIETLTQLYPEKQIIITGHHYGAATAILYGLSTAIAYPWINITVIALSAPRVGNENFNWLIKNEKSLNIWRFDYENDHVTQFPSVTYAHVGHLITLSDFGAIYSPCGENSEIDKFNFAISKFGRVFPSLIESQTRIDRCFDYFLSKALVNPSKFYFNESVLIDDDNDQDRYNGMLNSALGCAFGQIISTSDFKKFTDMM